MLTTPSGGPILMTEKKSNDVKLYKVSGMSHGRTSLCLYDQVNWCRVSYAFVKTFGSVLDGAKIRKPYLSKITDPELYGGL